MGPLKSFRPPAKGAFLKGELKTTRIEGRCFRCYLHIRRKNSYPVSQGPHSTMAMSLRRKYGKAVLRNKVKRILRHRYANSRHDFKGMDVIFVLKIPLKSDEGTFGQIRKDIDSLLRTFNDRSRRIA